MSISQIGADTANWVVAAPATGCTVNYPSGVTDNDLILAFYSFYLSGGGSPSSADGGSLITGSHLNFDGDNWMAAMSNTYASADGASDNWSFGGSSYATVGVVAYRGSVEIPSIHSVTASATATTATTIDAPSVSAQSGDVLICLYCFEDQVTSVSTPTDMTLIMSGSSSTMTLRAFSQAITSTGETGAKTLTWTNTRDSRAISFLLREGEGGGGGVPIAVFLNANQFA